MVWIVNDIVNLELKKIYNFNVSLPESIKKFMLQLVWNNIFIRGSEARPLGVEVEEDSEQREEEREYRVVRVVSSSKKVTSPWLSLRCG